MHTDSLIDTIINNLTTTLHQIDAQQITALETALLNAERIFVAGKGRTGLQIRGFAMRLMHMGLKVYVVDDVTTPSITSKDLLLIASGSGRTASLVNYAQQVQPVGAKLATITGSLDSEIASLASTVVVIPANNPKDGKTTEKQSVLVMGSLFEHSLGLLCDLMIFQLMASLDVSEEEMIRRHANLE